MKQILAILIMLSQGNQGGMKEEEVLHEKMGVAVPDLQLVYLTGPRNTIAIIC